MPLKSKGVSCAASGEASSRIRLKAATIEPTASIVAQVRRTAYRTPPAPQAPVIAGPMRAPNSDLGTKSSAPTAVAARRYSEPS